MAPGETSNTQRQASPPQRATRALRRAEQLVRCGQLGEAIQSLHQALAFGADRYDCYLRLARLYKTCRQWPEAVSAARKAVEVHPDRLTAREAVVALCLETRDFARAIDESKALLSRFPRHLPARDALGAAYIGIGDVVAATRVASELIRLDPSDPTHRFKKALLCQHQGENGMAVDEFQRVVAMAPDTDLARSAREQLEVLDLHQLHSILLLASDDPVFRVRLQRDPEEALDERGFRLSEWGRDRLDDLVDEDLAGTEGCSTPRLYH